jgi:mono/diheme cytochrome c family protein
MRLFSGIFLTLVIAALAGLAVVYGGLFEVAASSSHSPMTKLLLETTMRNAVKRSAKNTVVPVELPPASAGFRDYDEMCVICHGAPGRPDSELAQGLMPPAPDLARAAKEWSDAELFWITQNGIKMTGMPAWGHTHSDEELWALVAFVRELPGLSPEQYANLRAQASAQGNQGSHSH